MNVSVPPEIEAQLSPQALAMDLAIGLFLSGDATIGQAARVADLSQTAFLRELGRRRIPFPYGRDDLEKDLAAVDEILRQ